MHYWHDALAVPVLVMTVWGGAREPNLGANDLTAAQGAMATVHRLGCFGHGIGEPVSVHGPGDG